MQPTSGVRELTIEGYFRAVGKYYKLVCAFLVVIPLVATIIVFTMKPVYKATASILVEQGAPQVTKFDEEGRVQAVSYDERFMAQYNILTSRMLAQAVFNELQLGKIPEYAGARDPIEYLQKQIKVKIESTRKSPLFIVQVSGIDPLRVADIANALSRIYIEKDIENRKREYKEAGEFLDVQLADLEKKVQTSTAALNLYIQENKIVEVPDIEDKAKTFLEELKTSKIKIENDLSDASMRYKAKHPKIVLLNNQLADISRKIEQETANFLLLNQKLTKYRALKTEATTNQQVYASIMQSAKEKAVTGNMGLTNIRIIDVAVPPKQPSAPKKAMTIIISIFLSLFSSLGLAFFLESRGATVHMAEDIRMGIELPFLGYIPAVKGSKKNDIGPICHEDPTAVVCEHFRILRSSIIFAAPENMPLKTILITSALPGEGKSFVALNIAIAFSQIGENVALLDFDMHKSGMHKVLNSDKKMGAGLSDHLAGKADVSAIIRSTHIKNLSFISSGMVLSGTGNILTSANARPMLDGLKSRFDRVILDSPPILNVADAALLASIVDGVILVARFEETYLEDVSESKERILAAKGNLLGVIINDIDRDVEGHHYYKYHYGMKPG